MNFIFCVHSDGVIPFDEIDSRLDALGLDRKWLADASGRKFDSIRVALAPNALAKNRSPLLQKALSETIEAEEASRDRPPLLPDRIYLEPSREELRAWGRAYKASEYEEIDEWLIAALNAAADKANIVRFPHGEESFSPTSKLAEESGEHQSSLPYIDFRGGVAAGSQISTDISEEPMSVNKTYPDGHYALRVFGESMAPRIPDQALIVVKEWHDKGFPRKGTIVVYSDGFGSTLKEFGYRKPKEGEEADNMGNVPVLRSLNKAYPDVETIDGGRIDAVFVELL